MSALTKLRPASTTRRYARLSRSRESASRQRGSVGGNICPMSPRPAAPRMASVRACATASASECPTSPREYGISTPPSISFLPSPSTNRWESYPIPTRMSGVEDADREESGVLGVVDPDAGHRDAPGHLRRGEQGVEPVQRPGRERHADHGKIGERGGESGERRDRKSTRLNSSHVRISYAVFCLKKKTRRRLASTPRASSLYRRRTPVRGDTGRIAQQ